MKEKIVDGGKYLFIMYLMVSSNYLGTLFGCGVQRILDTNMIVKHLFGFMTMYFFISIVDDKSEVKTPTAKVLFTAAIYAVFVCSTKMNVYAWMAFIMLLAAVYLLSIYKESDSIKEKGKEIIGKIQKGMVYASVAVVVVGMLYYMGEKKLEYGKKFSFMTFIRGNPECSRLASKFTVMDKVNAVLKN